MLVNLSRNGTSLFSFRTSGNNLTGLSADLTRFSNTNQLDSMTNLDMSSSQLGDAGVAHVFNNFPAQLQRLTLNDNGITTLLALPTAASNVKTLTIEDNAALTSLSTGVFDNLANMTNLNLSANGLTTLSANLFDNIPKLRFVNLNDNAIATLPDGIFTGNQTLAFIYMTDNPIGNVAPSNFTGLSRMSYLHFGDRPATSGELARYRAPGIMPGLYQLRMAGANQPPRIDEQLDTDGNATRELPENSLEGTAVGMPLSATDPEGGVLYYIAGENTGQFTINESNGQLLAGPTESYDFEDATKNSYTVNVEVTDEHDATAMIDVKVTITNVDEAGTVMLSATAPKQGIAVTATLTDPDGGVSSATWQWASSNDGGTTWTDLSGNGADTASYTPQSGDVGNLLRATASYDDAQGSGKSASAQTGVVGQPPPKVTLVLTPDTIDEGGSGNVSTVTATLPAASSAATTITVSVNPTNTTTLSSNTTLTIAAGQTASTGVVTITAVDDNAYTGGQDGGRERVGHQHGRGDRSRQRYADDYGRRGEAGDGELQAGQLHGGRGQHGQRGGDPERGARAPGGDPHH